MMSERQGKRYTSRFKFQVMLEVLRGSKTIGQIARSYGVHPITITHWKREFLEKGPEIFGQQTTIHEYEKKVEELERLIGHKEVEIALLKNFLAGSSQPRRKSN
jgi:transposase-like protein